MAHKAKAAALAGLGVDPVFVALTKATTQANQSIVGLTKAVAGILAGQAEHDVANAKAANATNNALVAFAKEYVIFPNLKGLVLLTIFSTMIVHLP
jgi:hypothetical protein